MGFIWKSLKTLIVGLFFLLLIGLIASLAFALIMVREISRNLNAMGGLTLPTADTATRIYASDYSPETGSGTLLARLYLENREPVKLSEVPPELVSMILAVEDTRFWYHHGFEPRAILRAIYVDLTRGELKQGASTISQQLVRNVFLPHIKYQKTINRKMQEILLALAIENRYSKEEILESYINQIYFGQRSYGVKTAAHTYFGKELKDLTMAEMALLAGLPKAPTEYNPYRNPKAGKSRRNQVLARVKEVIRSDLLSFGKFTEADINKAMKEEVNLKSSAAPEYSLAPYFTDYVKEQLFERFDEDDVLRSGFIVVTTLNYEWQKKAQEILPKEVKAASKAYNVSEGALVTLDVKTGYIRAMVGGVDYSKSVFNRAVQAKRQPGSSFKVYTYSTAIEMGKNMGDFINDGKKVYPTGLGRTWSPKNSDNKYLGEIPLWYGIVQSRNSASVDLLNKIGVRNVIDTARKMGITTPLEENLSLTLGTNEVTLLDHTSGVACIPNKGVSVRPVAILKVFLQDGTLVEDNTRNIEERQKVAISPKTAHIMTVMMKAVINQGTGRRAQIGRPAAGKTGTTNDYKDAWFMGFTPDIATGVWVGNDNAKPMRRMFGGTTPARIWSQYMKEITKGTPVLQFEVPGGMERIGLPAFTKPPEEETEGAGTKAEDHKASELPIGDVFF